MKNLFSFFVLLLGNVVLLSTNVAAQTPVKFPDFGMTLSNGQFFKSTEIAKGKPVLLIYFAPDCDHCHTLMNAFFKQAAQFKKAEVVMVTFKPVNEVAAFERAYHTAQYSNIRVGTEGTTYRLRLFYKLQNTPFTALYNKEGKLVSSYRKETPLNEVLQQLRKLDTPPNKK